jgi:hypothetical protein
MIHTPNKFPFSGICGAKKSTSSPTEFFLLYFDAEIIDRIVNETDMSNKRLSPQHGNHVAVQSLGLLLKVRKCMYI